LDERLRAHLPARSAGAAPSRSTSSPLVADARHLQVLGTIPAKDQAGRLDLRLDGRSCRAQASGRGTPSALLPEKRRSEVRMQRLESIILVMATPMIACVGCGGGGDAAAPTVSPTTSHAATSPVGSTRINDTDTSIIYSKGNSSTADWSYFKPAPEDYLQDEHSSNFVRGAGAIPGVGLVVNFTGTGITWIGKKGPQYGIASYSIDGGPPQTVDNYNAGELAQNAVLTLSGLSSESHVLAISLLDRKNASATGYWQTIDGFSLDGSALTPSQGTVAGFDSSELVFKGSWQGGRVSDGSDLSGGHYWSNEANASISWTFVGSLIEVFGRPDYENGYMDVYMDGAPSPVASINGHWGSDDDDTLNSYLLFAKKLAPGQHTIKVVVTGKHDATAKDNYVQIDQFLAFQ
jgi:hypothetical protein